MARNTDPNEIRTMVRAAIEHGKRDLVANLGNKAAIDALRTWYSSTFASAAGPKQKRSRNTVRVALLATFSRDDLLAFLESHPDLERFDLVYDSRTVENLGSVRSGTLASMEVQAYADSVPNVRPFILADADGDLETERAGIGDPSLAAAE